ncbi:MAG: glycosyl hydrolase family 18 protein [Thermoproteota archaeon]
MEKRIHLFVATILALILIVIIEPYAIKMSNRNEDIGIDFSTVSLERLEVRLFGWVTGSEESFSSFIKNADHFTWVSPTESFVNASGFFVGRVDQRVVNVAKENDVSIVPLVANAGFEKDLMHRILSDRSTRERTISSIVRFVLDENYSGINIDWENIPEEDREALNSYMKELSERLHDCGKIVTIDVSGKTSDETTGWSGAWDYEALGEVCDYVCIMVYDFHWSGSNAGPVGPKWWLEEVIQYALSTIPREKIVIGIPLYGYDWVGNKGEYVSFNQALRIAKEKGAKITFRESDGEYTYSYDVLSNRHEVWFQGAKSAEVKIKSVLASGIDRIAVWSIGQEDPRTWEVIGRKK